MKSKTIIFLILIVLVAFSYGLLVGHYEIFPFSVLSEIKNTSSQLESNERLQIYQETSHIQNLISFNSISDIDNTKQMLNEYIWNDPKLPSDLVTKHEYDVKDSMISKLKNLERIDSFTVEMNYGMNSISYLFLAENTNNKLIIYHYVVV